MLKNARNYEKKSDALIDLLGTVIGVILVAGLNGIAAITCLVLGILAFISLPAPNNLFVAVIDLLLVLLNVVLIVEKFDTW